MNRLSKAGAAIALMAASLVLSACTTGLPTRVTRFSAMPAPSGQTFAVVQSNGEPGGLEFQSFAAVVAKQMETRGYQPAASPAAADMLVKVDYGVDQGHTMMVRDAFSDPWGDPFGWSPFGFWSNRSGFLWGWDDPFWYRGGFGWDDSIHSYTEYFSFLDLDIVRRADNAPLFEGHAKGRSATDNLTRLVPDLVEAMFTGFPGQNGETVKITVPPRKD